jgi:hypothetical protein
MDADTAWKTATLDQEGDLRSRALDLQQQGMSADDSYRYSALEQDDKFRTEAQRLQELGLTNEQSYREAALTLDRDRMEQQDKQFTEEMEFRLARAKTSDERFKIIQELNQKYLDELIESREARHGGGENTTKTKYEPE